MSKSLFKSKTFWANVLGGAAQLLNLAVPVIPPPYGIVAQAVLNVLVRLVTSGPVHVA